MNRSATEVKTVSRLLLILPLALLVLGGSALAAWWVRGRLQPPASRQSPVLDESASRQQGQLLYRTLCASCHGAEGHGDGPSAADSKPPPRDFSHGMWKFGITPAAIRKVIRDGIPGTPMPASPTLSERDLDDLVTHVLTMAPRELPMPAETAALLRQAGFTPAATVRSASFLDLRGLDGKPRNLADFQGKTLLLNFWATTCLYCLDELPELERIDRDHHDKGLAVVSVCFDENQVEKVAKLARGRVQKLPVFTNPDGQARLRYDVEIMPVVYLISPDGRLLGHVQGARKWTEKDVELILTASKNSK